MERHPESAVGASSLDRIRHRRISAAEPRTPLQPRPPPIASDTPSSIQVAEAMTSPVLSVKGDTPLQEGGATLSRSPNQWFCQVVMTVAF